MRARLGRARILTNAATALRLGRARILTNAATALLPHARQTVPLRTSEAEQRARTVAWHSRSLWLYLAVLVVRSFFLNWFWERIQRPAYPEMAGGPRVGTVAT